MVSECAGHARRQRGALAESDLRILCTVFGKKKKNKATGHEQALNIQ